MYSHILPSQKHTSALLLLATALVVAPSTQQSGAQVVQHYKQTNLVSNLSSLAPTMDPNLVNSWGLTRSSKSPWWVADNATGLATLYDGTGKIMPLVVTIPPADTSSTTGTPTGIVFNGNSAAFPVAPGKAASFLFVTEDGTISGWNPNVKATQAVIVVNNKEKSVYKGATIATADKESGTETYLYVADFRKGRIEVFDANFHKATPSEDRFEDDSLPEGYAPFNVQNIGGNLYVAYAKQDSAKHDEVDGAGLGRVDIFSPRGKLLNRLQNGPWFNAPWGMALASGDFGIYSHDVLVGQFGSGEILAFDPVTGKFKGKLIGLNGNPVHIDGLWAIAFGNDASAGPATTLYFASGPDHESNGLFGSLTAVENAQGSEQ